MTVLNLPGDRKTRKMIFFILTLPEVETKVLFIADKSKEKTEIILLMELTVNLTLPYSKSKTVKLYW